MVAKKSSGPARGRPKWRGQGRKPQKIQGTGPGASHEKQPPLLGPGGFYLAPALALDCKISMVHCAL